MKTISTLTNKPSLKLLAVCGLLFAAAAVFACTKFPMSWFGSGGFNNPQRMGDVRAYLDGTTASALWVNEANYDAQCRTLAYTFAGTTANGYNISGTAEPAKGKHRQTSLTTFTMAVTSISVSDPATGAVLATDDGGFKIDFASTGSGFGAKTRTSSAAPAQTDPNFSGIYFPHYEGTLKFPRAVTDACPLVQRGDEGTVIFFAFAGGGNGNNKTDLGEVTFSTTTTAGVLVSGQGHLVVGSNSGTLTVTSLTIGDPAAAYCAIAQLDINVGLHLNKPHGRLLGF